MAEELEGFGAEEGDFLAPRGEGGELLLLRGLEEAVVVEVHELLQMAVRLWRQLELTDGADPGLGRWNGGGHGGKSKIGLLLSMPRVAGERRRDNQTFGQGDNQIWGVARAMGCSGWGDEEPRNGRSFKHSSRHPDFCTAEIGTPQSFSRRGRWFLAGKWAEGEWWRFAMVDGCWRWFAVVGERQELVAGLILELQAALG